MAPRRVRPRARRASTRTTSWSPSRGGRAPRDKLADLDPARSAPRRPGRRGREAPQGLRRPAADRRPVVLAAARRHRRRDRAERRRQDHAVPHDRRRGEARRRHVEDRPDRRARVRRPVARLARRRQRPSSRRSPAASTWSIVGEPRGARSRAYVARFNFKGIGPAEAGRRSLRRRAQPRPPREGAEDAAATSCCSTSRRTTSTSTRCARSKTRCSSSPAAPS